MNMQANGSSRKSKRLLTFTMILFVLALGITIGTLISNQVDATGPGDSQLKIQTDGKPVAGGAVLDLSKAFEEVASRIEQSGIRSGLVPRDAKAALLPSVWACYVAYRSTRAPACP